MSTLALILARAGSKGVPGKNRALVAGRPCVAWTIDAARSARLVDHVAVSTDDPNIADLATSLGVTALARPPHLASDTARVNDAARDAVLAFDRLPPSPHFGPAKWGEGRGEGRELADAPPRRSPISTIVLLYANVPIRPHHLIDRALQLLRDSNADSVQSYQPVGKHHPWWTARVNPDTGDIRPWEGDVLNHNVFRRQDLPPAHIPDGGVLVVTRRALFLEVPGVPPGPHAFFGLDRRGLINPEGSVIDIDSPIDLLVANAILSNPRA